MRTILLGITGCAVFFLIIGQALRGHTWAVVIAVALASIFVTLAVHSLVFLATTFLSKLVGTQELSARTSQGGLQSNSEEQVPLPIQDSKANG